MDPDSLKLGNMRSDPSPTPRYSCCSRSSRRSVSNYFDRGYRRRLLPMEPIVGEESSGCGKLKATFGLRVEAGLIKAASFRSTTCITLVAYCELLGEMATGMMLREAIQITPEKLIDGFTEVPLAKQDRAVLALKALATAIIRAVEAGNHRV